MPLPTELQLTAEERARAQTHVPAPLKRAPVRLTPGRLIYVCWHRPLQLLQPRHRYLWEQRRVQRRMRAAERRLRFPAGTGNGAPIEITFLVGKQYVPQCVFAMTAWARHSGRPVSFQCFDDGTLDAAAIERLQRPPWKVEVEPRAAVDARLDAALPVGRYPFLRQVRLGYPHLGKLTDVFAGRTGWHCVADTDVVVQREPSELLQHFDARRPFYFADVTESYGLPRDTLAALVGCTPPARVNSGCFGFDAAQLDWNFLEWATGRILAHHGFTFYLEQALVALLMARLGGRELSPAYRVFPSREEAMRPTAAALHFLNGAHNPDLVLNWQRLLQ